MKILIIATIPLALTVILACIGYYSPYKTIFFDVGIVFLVISFFTIPIGLFLTFSHDFTKRDPLVVMRKYLQKKPLKTNRQKAAE